MQDAIDITTGDFFPILNAMDQGILIINATGVIVFCNQFHCKMDGLEEKDIIGRKVVDVYHLDNSSSLLMRALHEKRAFHNTIHIYEARNGRFVNSISNIFPMQKNGQHIGAISYVKEYEYLDGLINTIDGSHKRAVFENTTRFSFEDIIGSAPLFQETVKKSKMSANSPSPIMLYGETGTGKELFAQSIHNYSHRKKKNYMAVNCAAIPETLLEGILFGSTKGAFTGAMEKPGLFEQANGGTLFLDELNSMPIGLQGKLLRVLQEKKVRRVGAVDEIPLDLKIISSTNKSPANAIEDGELRRDLFYRLGVVFLAIPPLKERLSDLDKLIDYFIKKYNLILGKNVQHLSNRVKSLFHSYVWPGNVRELENAIEGAMNMVGDRQIIQLAHMTSDFTPLVTCHEREFLPVTTVSDSAKTKQSLHIPSVAQANNPSEVLHSEVPRTQLNFLDKNNIENVLLSCRGNVKQTAAMLEISRQALHRKIKKHGISPKHILAKLEIESIEKSLASEKGNITLAARRLSISRQLLNYKIKKYGISRNPFIK